jgi:hypothetical protein
VFVKTEKEGIFHNNNNNSEKREREDSPLLFFFSLSYSLLDVYRIETIALSELSLKVRLAVQQY